MADFKTIDECEKQALIQDESNPQPTPKQLPRFHERLIRHVFPCILLLLSVSILFRKVFVCHHHYDPNKYLPGLEDEEWELVSGNTTKVALEAHIMSKCPDARDCLQKLVVPTMVKVGDKVDFRLSYIGSLDPHSDDVQCKHGPSECLGNIIQLCAAHTYPEPIKYLGFANCMTSDYPKIPDRDLIESCALEHGIEFSRLNDCISQEGEGMNLLRESVRHSQNVGVSTSCTVRLQDKVWCIRDGGQWKDCPNGNEVDDLVNEIEKLYQYENSVF